MYFDIFLCILWCGSGFINISCSLKCRAHIETHSKARVLYHNRLRRTCSSCLWDQLVRARFLQFTSSAAVNLTLPSSFLFFLACHSYQGSFSTCLKSCSNTCLNLGWWPVLWHCSSGWSCSPAEGCQSSQRRSGQGSEAAAFSQGATAATTRNCSVSKITCFLFKWFVIWFSLSLCRPSSRNRQVWSTSQVWHLPPLL